MRHGLFEELQQLFPCRSIAFWIDFVGLSHSFNGFVIFADFGVRSGQGDDVVIFFPLCRFTRLSGQVDGRLAVSIFGIRARRMNPRQIILGL